MKYLIHQLLQNRSKKVGLLPGSVVPIGEKKTEKAKITLISYDEEKFYEQEFKTIEEALAYKSNGRVLWINIDGVSEADIIEKVGEHFDIHSLVQEDIVTTSQRPRMMEYEQYIYFVLKMIYFDDKGVLTLEQVSLILGKDYVVTFQEKPGDVFDLIRQRLRAKKGRIRKERADYLFYSLFDSIVDEYFTVLERVGESVEDFSENLLTNPEPSTLARILEIKEDIILIRKAAWPSRELINRLMRTETPLIRKNLVVYIRDIYDHVIQVIDTIETYRDMLSSLLDVYMSSLSNKLNEIMKTLTIIATIFMPLTFLTGFYGMNFKFMNEFNWPHGYLWAIGEMVLVSLIMLIYFRKKKWM